MSNDEGARSSPLKVVRGSSKGASAELDHPNAMRGSPMSKREALTLKGKRRNERGRVPTMKGRVQCKLYDSQVP
jgi:hypothetical protein